MDCKKGFFVCLFLVNFSFSAYAARVLNLSLVTPQQFDAQTSKGKLNYRITRRTVDFNQTTHVHIQQTYQNYPIWGADAIMHIPSVTKLTVLQANMTGKFYIDLQKDLIPPSRLKQQRLKQQNINQYAIALYKKQLGKEFTVSALQSSRMIYIDQQNKAHWVYHIQFDAQTQNGNLFAKPIYLLDANNLTVWLAWDNLKTFENVTAGGFGGNHKTGQKIYDGGQDNLFSLALQRDADTKLCYMQNELTTIYNAQRRQAVMTFPCDVTSPEHHDVYWNGNHDQIATTWSPSNDALFGADIAVRLFKAWYQIPILVDKFDKPMRLKLYVHDDATNAFWIKDHAVFGDSIGSKRFNPFTQLDTIVHELGHGFTQQQSDLQYYGQCGGLNESFSDMVGIAAEYFLYGKTDYLVGWGDVQANGKALRYMDKPSRDCEGRKPGDECSIDNVKQYRESLNVHYSSGIFNRVYYLLANADNWNARKALDVMVQANRHYWTPTSSFQEAACGVLKSTHDYGYDDETVVFAFKQVGIKLNNCI